MFAVDETNGCIRPLLNGFDKLAVQDERFIIVFVQFCQLNHFPSLLLFMVLSLPLLWVSRQAERCPARRETDFIKLTFHAYKL
jgi:hypothetical protein